MLKQSILCRTYCVTRILQRGCQWRSKSSQSKSSSTPLRRLLDDASGFGESEQKEPELQWATEPYAAKPGEERGTPRVDPQESAVLLFPGQGAQRVGMGRRLLAVPKARDLYELASSVVGWDVARVCMEGPEEELMRRCQTAVMVTSLAALELLRDERPAALERVRACAGFSLGEITALVWAGALQLDAALRLVELRTAAMRAAAAARPGGMLTLWLAADADLPRLLRRAADAAAAAGVPDPVCQVANYMYPGCKVIAGDERALRHVEGMGAAAGVRRAARVQVEGAFHTPLMGRAAEAVGAALRAMAVAAPRARVVSAIDACTYGDAGDVRRRLTRHVSRPVRWEQTLQLLYARARGERFPLTLALGPGGALRATLRQINARAWDSSLQIDA